MLMNSKNELLNKIVAEALEGIPADITDALTLSETASTDELLEAAGEVARKWDGDRIDTCSILNARSGKCTEDCKWCAQSMHYNTGIKEYPYIPHDEAVEAGAMNASKHVSRFSLVTSGRKVAPADMEHFCSIFRHLRDNHNIHLCASMGLLSKSQMLQLKEAGVSRYHCNLETSDRYFKTLCTTHTREDKLMTIQWAREAGLEICSGGIIGMGESMADRLALAAEAREAGAVSIPVNILSPIPGTPLGNQELLSEEEIMRSVTLMKLVAPKCRLRFAGGRARLSDEATARLLKGGVGGSMVGDLLTTAGKGIDRDYAIFDSLGLKY